MPWDRLRRVRLHVQPEQIHDWNPRTPTEPQWALRVGEHPGFLCPPEAFMHFAHRRTSNFFFVFRRERKMAIDDKRAPEPPMLSSKRPTTTTATSSSNTRDFQIHPLNEMQHYKHVCQHQNCNPWTTSEQFAPNLDDHYRHRRVAHQRSLSSHQMGAHPWIATRDRMSVDCSFEKENFSAQNDRPWESCLCFLYRRVEPFNATIMTIVLSLSFIGKIFGGGGVMHIFWIVLVIFGLFPFLSSVPPWFGGKRSRKLFLVHFCGCFNRNYYFNSMVGCSMVLWFWVKTVFWGPLFLLCFNLKWKFKVAIVFVCCPNLGCSPLLAQMKKIKH